MLRKCKPSSEPSVRIWNNASLLSIPPRWRDCFFYWLASPNVFILYYSFETAPLTESVASFSLRSRSPDGVGYCLQYPFLRAGARFDIGANRSSQVTREVGLADLKASTGAPRQCYWRQHPTPLAVRSGSEINQVLPHRKAPTK